jgi:hypothetical protein
VPLAGLAAYSTAKYAVRGFSESLRMQLAKDGIGVSCLFPGATRTALVPLPEDDPEHIKEEGAPQFLKDLWDAMRGAIDPYDTGKAVVAAIKENRFYIFTNREFLDEVKQRHREIEDAFPTDEPTPGRVKFETMRSEMVRNLMAPATAPCRSRRHGLRARPRLRVAGGRSVIYLLRHGQTEYNTERRIQGRCDSPLTELGRKQAAAMGETLRGLIAGADDFAVVSSPLPRAYSSAELVAEESGIAGASSPTCGCRRSVADRGRSIASPRLAGATR